MEEGELSRNKMGRVMGFGQETKTSNSSSAPMKSEQEIKAKIAAMQKALDEIPLTCREARSYIEGRIEILEWVINAGLSF